MPPVRPGLAARPGLPKPVVPPPTAPVAAPRVGYWDRFGGRYMVWSVLAHILFFAIAAWLLVQTIQARARSFQGGPKGAYALEHSVHVQPPNTPNAPRHLRRIMTTGVSPLTAPDLPPMPAMDAAFPPSMVIAKATPAPTPVPVDAGARGAVDGAGGKTGKGRDYFGEVSSTAGLAGTFYDLKQTPTRQPTGMTPRGMEAVMADFVRGGFNAGVLKGYFRAPHALYTTQVFTPMMHAELGPAAFQMEHEVQPTMWLVHYKGKVIPPEDGTYDFVGFGDDYLLVRFNGRLVLDGSLHPTSSWSPQSRYTYPSPYLKRTGGTPRGESFTVRAGQAYPLEIVIGEQPGGMTFADLLIEKAGVTYKTDAGGNPILPVFRLATSVPSTGASYLPHDDGGPVWNFVEAR